MKHRYDDGLTLIEVTIVVAIISIVLAIAIPRLMSARKSGNEASAIATLRALRAANEQYKTRYNRFSSSLRNLQTSGFIDSVLGGGTKSGYTFTYVGSSHTWTTRAVPSTSGTTGDRSFFVDTTGVLRFVQTGTATSASPPLN